MKKNIWTKMVITTVLIFFVMSSLSPAQMQSEQINEADEDYEYMLNYCVTFSKDDFMFDTLMNYDIVKLNKGIYINDIGKPMVPAKEIKIALPDGMAVKQVQVVDTQSEEIKGEYTIFPAQPPRRSDGSNTDIAFAEPDSKIYASANPYPSRLVEFAYQTDLAGQGIATIRISPLQYTPSQKKLTLYTSITFIVTGVGGYICGDYLPRCISENGREIYEQMIKDIVINPEEIELNTDPGGSPSTLSLPPGGPYDHVIICRSSDVSYWDDLAEWHTKRGLKDTVVTTTYIYDNYGGSSDQAKIRNFVIDAHSTWGTMYFLLCGENGDVPFKYRSYEDDSIPSDQYYGDYDDDWEYEVFVGRSTACGSTQVNRFVDKVLKYEKDPPLTNYPLDITLLGMDLTTEWEWPWFTLTRGEDLKELIDNYIPSRFTVTKVYDTDSGNHKTAFINALNDGQNLVNHVDHGWCDTMCTGDRRHGWYIDNSDVDALTNTNRMCNVFSVGCHCNEMDDYSCGGDCIAEHFVIYNDLKAGVSFTGNTRSGWFYVGEPDTLSGHLDRYWWRAIFNYNKYKLGEALAHTKQYCSHSDDVEKYCHWTLNLLGEPEMSIWTDIPDSFYVTYPAELPIGSSSFTVHVEVGGGDVQNAYICLWKGDEVYLTGTTNSAGDKTFYPSPTSTGIMYVTVTKHNYIPYEGEATVFEEQNNPPNKPSTPSGPILIPADYEQLYSTSTTDPESHLVYYKWDWGDEVSGWIGPYTSGSMAYASHTWTVTGDYNVKVKAKDDPNGDGDLSDGLESTWSNPLLVNVVIPGDLDGDGDVDLADLAELLGHYGTTSGATYEMGDIDGDGDVDLSDLAELLGHYGAGV